MAEQTLNRPWALLSPDGFYHVLQEPTFFVGRHENVHLMLKSRSVDKEHAVITAQPDQGIYCVHDLESLNGTFVNERRVQRAVLRLKDTIRFGYDPKWVAIEDDRTFVDLLRYTTGDQFTKSKMVVVVSGEVSRDKMVRVSLKDSVMVLEDKDKKMVSFLLEPENKLSLFLMNTFRVDLLPCEESKPTMFEENNNTQGYMMESHDYLQDTDCCKGLNESPNIPSDQVMSRLCHNCGSKTADANRLTSIVKGSTLYGQPSWWGWESSDEEFYTYPNCATVVTQAGTLAIPTQHCTVLQSRIQRNKARIEHSLKSGSKNTNDAILPKASEEDNEVLKECRTSLNHPPVPQPAHPVYNVPVPVFGAWEAVPQGGLDEGPEELGLDVEEKLLRTSLSYHIPLMPEYGEIPEKPVSEKSSRAARRRSNTKQLTQDVTSSSSFASEASDLDNDSSRPTPNYPGSVFGMTEVNVSGNISERWTKGIEVGKPKLTSPVKVKTSGPKPSTPRSVTETNKSKRVHGVATAGTTEDVRTPTKSTRPVTRAPSSGGSSVPSDCESRDSDRSQNQSVFTSTSDDSDGEHEGRTTSRDDKCNSAEKRKKNAMPSLYGKEKHHRPSSAASALPRANKTAMLRALNSREVVRNSVSSSGSRLHSCKKTRHRHSTPAATTNRENSPVDSNSSLRIWSPSITRSPSSGKTKRPLSGGSTPRCFRTSNQSVSDDYETQTAVDAIFESNDKPAYVLPKELQMNRNDNKNKTFVLEEKSDKSSTSPGENKPIQTPDAGTRDIPVFSRERTIDLLRPKTMDANKAPETSQPSEATNRPIAKPSLPMVSAWMPLPDNGRSASPESLVSVPPATSPSPPSTPRSSAKHLIQERSNCCSAPPQSRRQWDVTDKPVEDLMLSSVHAFTVELRLASESVLSKARDLYEFVSNETTQPNKGDTLGSKGKQDGHSNMPEWKSSHAEIAGVFRNLRRVEFNLKTMDQALSFLCSASGKETCKTRSRSHLPERVDQNSQSWKDFKARARTFSWAEENKNIFPTGPPSDDEEVTTP